MMHAIFLISEPLLCHVKNDLVSPGHQYTASTLKLQDFAGCWAKSMVFWGLEGHLKESQHMTEGVSYADGLPPETGLVHHK
ncbi:MAG: hypothetical protein M0R18_12015, partial [Deltaproteobacteria bacterium]|nr:hypothetical protein [Deltaproteobacteria bacterium]